MKKINDKSNYIQPLLPSGVKDILPVEAAELNFIKKRLAKSYESWGFEEVFTPAFEYFDVLSLQAGERIKKEMFKFLDDRGDLLALRPDMTISIARLVSQKFKDANLPLRLYYQATVFRQQKPFQGQPREFWQSGVELIGAGKVATDAEIIMLLIDSLKALGLSDFKVSLSNIAFVKSFLDILANDAPDLKKYLSAKNLVSVNEVLAGLKSTAAKNLQKIINLRGSQALIKAQKLATDNNAKAALKQLTQLAQLLQKRGYDQYVTYDFSLMPDFDYYTGAVFEAYVEGLGAPIASGGRYDNLLSVFGNQNTAAGFAFGLERLHLAMVNQGEIKIDA